jgi:hypothetical protein
MTIGAILFSSALSSIGVIDGGGLTRRADVILAAT